MRKTFVKSLIALASKDPRVLLLTGDLGYSVLEPFRDQFPEQFINVGIAEQNMVGVATGLADAGFIPYIYSIATFTVLRPFEFIRNGAAFHRKRVRLVGVGSAFEYGSAGITHHALEDIGVLRMLPELKIVVPADDPQAETALLETKDLPGPIYYRLSKNEGVLPELKGRFDFESLQTVRSGQDALIIAMGPLAKEAMVAARDLETQGIKCQISIFSSFNPSPREEIRVLAKQFPLILTVESHYDVGGLGSLVSEIVAEEGIPCRVIRQGVKNKFMHDTGGEAYLNRLAGLTRADIAASVADHLSAIEKTRTSRLIYEA